MSEEAAIVHTDTTHVHPQDPSPPIQAVPSPDGDGTLFLYRDGFSVQEMPGPKVRRREHVFHDLESFAHYLNRHATDKTRTEILVDVEHVTAALHPRDMAGDVVTCKLMRSPRFEAWSGAFGRPLSQKDMVRLVRAQRGDLDARVADLLLGSLRSMKVSGSSKLEVELDERGYTRFATTSGGRQIEGQLPPELTLTLPIFDGVKRELEVSGLWTEALYTIDVLLSLDVESTPVFQLDAPGLPTVLRQARRDAATYLQHLLDEGLMVGLGTFQTRESPAYSGLLSQPIDF